MKNARFPRFVSILLFLLTALRDPDGIFRHI